MPYAVRIVSGNGVLSDEINSWTNVHMLSKNISAGYALLCRHNERDSISNHQRLYCLLSRLFRRRWKITSKFRVTGLCVGNSPVTGEFPTQRASNAENASIWWRHHDYLKNMDIYFWLVYTDIIRPWYHWCRLFLSPVWWYQEALQPSVWLLLQNEGYNAMTYDGNYVSPDPTRDPFNTLRPQGLSQRFTNVMFKCFLFWVFSLKFNSRVYL